MDSDDSDDAVDTVNTPIDTAKSSEHGFRTWPENLRDSDTQQVSARRADECRHAVAELQTLVARLGGRAESSGSASAAMHHGWLAVKETLAGHSDKAILDEIEHGDDSALSGFRKALEQLLPPALRIVVERRLEGVRGNQALVRALRSRASTALQ